MGIGRLGDWGLVLGPKVQAGNNNNNREQGTGNREQGTGFKAGGDSQSVSSAHAFSLNRDYTIWTDSTNILTRLVTPEGSAEYYYYYYYYYYDYYYYR